MRQQLRGGGSSDLEGELDRRRRSRAGTHRGYARRSCSSPPVARSALYGSRARCDLRNRHEARGTVRWRYPAENPSALWRGGETAVVLSPAPATPSTRATAGTAKGKQFVSWVRF